MAYDAGIQDLFRLSGMETVKFMSILEGIVLGIVQGVTEFIPVSSSGHLVLAENLLGFNPTGVRLEVALHVGTLMAVLVFYRARIVGLVCGFFRRSADALHYAAALIVGTIPATLAYILGGKQIERTFESPAFVIAALACTGLALLTLAIGDREPAAAKVDWFRGMIVGAAQAVALLPGISRSGATVVAGRHLGLAPDAAAEFSLLLSVPAIAGAMVMKGCHGWSAEDDIPIRILLLAAAVSGVVGYAAILWLVRLLRSSRLWVFGIYCLAVSAIGGVAMLLGWRS